MFGSTLRLRLPPHIRPVPPLTFVVLAPLQQHTIVDTAIMTDKASKAVWTDADTDILMDSLTKAAIDGCKGYGGFPEAVIGILYVPS